MSTILPPNATQLNELLNRGYDLLESGSHAAACDAWLQAWELLKQLATPNIRTCDGFDHVCPTEHFTNNWCNDLDTELHNVAIDNPVYHERRLQVAREFVALFPDEIHNRMNFMQAIGDSLWALGRQAEAEDVFADLLAQFEDEGWAYAYASDPYWLMSDSPKSYQQAEEILLRGLNRTTISDRDELLERLRDLYAEWGKPDLRDEIQRQLEHVRAMARVARQSSLPPAVAKPSPPPSNARMPGRNDPCWCGSGKKYKYCHLREDEA